MQVGSLGREDPTDKGMAAHSSSLAWRIPWAEEPGGFSPWGCNRVGHDLVAKLQKHLLITYLIKDIFICAKNSKFNSKKINNTILKMGKLELDLNETFHRRLTNSN